MIFVARREEFGLVLLDWSIPGISVTEVLVQIKMLASEMLVAIMTSFGDLVEGSAGSNEILARPFRAEELGGGVETSGRVYGLDPIADVVDEDFNGVCRVDLTSINGEVVEQGIVPIGLMKIVQITLTPLVVLLYELLRLAAVYFSVLHHGVEALVEGGNDFYVAGVGVVLENCLASSTDDDGFASLAEVLNEGSDQQLIRAAVEVSGTASVVLAHVGEFKAEFGRVGRSR